MKTAQKKILKLFLLIGVLVLAFFFIRENIDDFKKIAHLSLLEHAYLSVFILGGIILNGYLFKRTLKHYHISLKFTTWFGLTIINRYANLLFVKAGVVARSVYLKREHGLAYRDFLISFVYIALVQIMVSALMVLLAGVFIQEANIIIFFFFTLLLLGSLMSFVVSGDILAKLASRLPFAENLVEKWLLIRKDRKLLTAAFIIMNTIVLLGGLKIYVMYGMMFQGIPFTVAVMISAVGFLSVYAAITPGALGIKEALMSYIAKLAGEDMAQAAVVSVLDRAITVFWVIALGFAFSFWYSKNINKKIYEKNK